MRQIFHNISLIVTLSLHCFGFFASLHQDDQLVVQDQDQSAPDRPQHVGEVALEEGLRPLVLGDLSPAIHGPLVHLFSLALAGHHHQAPPDCVEGIGDGNGAGGDGLSDGELGQEAGVVHHGLGGVVGAEVDGAVHDDTLNGTEKSGIQSADESVSLVTLADAIEETFELTLRSGFADVGAEPSPGEIQRVDDRQARGARGPAGRQVAGEELPEVLVLVEAVHEHLFVGVLEGEVQGLRGEVADDVDDVAPPEAENTLLLVDPTEAVDEALVLLVLGDELAGLLDLEQDLDSLQGSDDRLGHGGGDAAGDEVQHEVSAAAHGDCLEEIGFTLKKSAKTRKFLIFFR